jgi:hypothetical protein
MNTTTNEVKTIGQATRVLGAVARGEAGEQELNAVRSYVSRLKFSAPEDFGSLSAAIVCAKRAAKLRAAGDVAEAAKYDELWAA